MGSDRDGFDALLDTLWTTWGGLGVHGWARGGARAVVDPEALIVITVQLGDLRLVHETIDWGFRHAQLLSIARLRHLARRAGTVEQLEQWIATVAAGAPHVRWRAARPGLVMDDFSGSGESRPYDEADPGGPATTLLRLRALTGPTMRSDVVRALHPVARGLEASMSTAEIARHAAGTSPGVLAVLRELTQAGFVRQLGSDKRRRYLPRADHPVSRATWGIWRDAPHAPWSEALDAVPTLSALRRAGGPGTDAARVADALDLLDRERPALEALTGDAPPRRPQGSVQHVARALAAIADEGLHRAARLLVDGR